MRIGQLKSLTESELSLLSYIVNLKDPPDSPRMEFKPNHLLWFKKDVLLNKIKKNHQELNDEGKIIFESLSSKLNKTIEQEREEYEHTTKPELTQSEFQF